jgi:Flp pilus assembly CpaE family ATPase
MPSQRRFTILLIEDTADDAELVLGALAGSGDEVFEVHRVESLLPGLDRLSRGDIDLVLLDVSLPDSHGLDGLNAIHIYAPDLPVVILTGWDNESLALRAVQSGAQDYLIKGKLDGPALARTLEHTIVRHQTRMAASTRTIRGSAKVLALLGVKGGVGTTTVACHLARELRRQSGGRVLIMDLDASANVVGFLMKAEGPYNILHASDDVLRLDRSRWSKLVVPCADGVDVMQSGGVACREEQRPRAERVRYILRFARSLYRYIVIDMGRLNPFSTMVASAEDVGALFLVSTCDALALHEAKETAKALLEAGVSTDQLGLMLNQVPVNRTFTNLELQKMLGVQVKAVLPEVRKDFAHSAQDGKWLGESRLFQRHVAHFAFGFMGVHKAPPESKSRFSLLQSAFRRLNFVTERPNALDAGATIEIDRADDALMKSVSVP